MRKSSELTLTNTSDYTTREKRQLWRRWADRKPKRTRVAEFPKPESSSSYWPRIVLEQRSYFHHWRVRNRRTAVEAEGETSGPSTPRLLRRPMMGYAVCLFLSCRLHRSGGDRC